MQFFAKFSVLAVLSVASFVGASENGVRAVDQRQLQDPGDLTEIICTACDVCDALTDICDLGAIAELACGSCEIFGVDGLCQACSVCDDVGDQLCDLDSASELACGLCDIDIPDIPNIPDAGDLCFSEIATVQVQGTGPVAMKDLKIGDRILTADNNYDSVYAFAHHSPSKPAEFFQIHSADTKRPLEVTADHLVFLQDMTEPVPSKDVHVGDTLRNGSIGSIVTKIGTVQRNGIYAPLTTGGTLVVDGITASSYIQLDDKERMFSDHALIHLTLTPYRMVCQGISARFGDPFFSNEDGMPHYVSSGLGLLRWLFASNIVVQTLGLTAIFAVTGTFRLLECLLGASLAPLVLFLVTYAYASRNKNKDGKFESLMETTYFF